MIGNSSPSVKSVSFNPGDTTNRLSLGFAVEQGYTFRLDADGDAEVSKPDGATYYVVNFVCDCPDAQGRNGGSYNGHCKHSIWASQLLPCELCGGTMALGQFKTFTGSIGKIFSCPDCGNARDAALVRQERRERRREAEHVA